MGLLAKVTVHFILLCSILFICCSCLDCGEKRSHSSVHEVREPIIKPIKTSSIPNQDSSNKSPHIPLLVNSDFTIEELPRGEIKFKKKRLRMGIRTKIAFLRQGITRDIPEHMVNRAPRKTVKLPEQGKSIIWLSSHAIYAMQLDSCELWADYWFYGDWSVESICLAEAEYPNVLLGVSGAALFPNNRILKIDMSTGGLNGYFELPENLAGPDFLHSLGDDRYFAVSYQGDESYRLSLLNLGDKPIVEKAIVFNSAGGYKAISDDDKVFYFITRGLFISFDIEKLEILKVQEMKGVPVGRITLLPYRNELCVFSSDDMRSFKLLTVVDTQSFEVLNSFELPMQPALQDRVEGKSRIVLQKKGDPTYLSPSGVTYRNQSDELIITFDYSPNMLFINCGTKEQRFVKFAEESIADGQPVYFDEEHLLIGGKYIHNFKTGSAKQIVGAENSSVLRSLIYF